MPAEHEVEEVCGKTSTRLLRDRMMSQSTLSTPRVRPTAPPPFVGAVWVSGLLVGAAAVMNGKPLAS